MHLVDFFFQDSQLVFACKRQVCVNLARLFVSLNWNSVCALV